MRVFACNKFIMYFYWRNITKKYVFLHNPLWLESKQFFPGAYWKLKLTVGKREVTIYFYLISKHVSGELILLGKQVPGLYLCHFYKTKYPPTLN